MAYGTVNADLMTTSDGVSSSGLYGFKNRILNGQMVIDQRNAGASVTGNSGVHPVDRWTFNTSQSSKFTGQRNAGSVTPPAGFTNYLGVTSSSAYSLLSGDYFAIGQHIEGFNVADLGYGAAGAQTVAVSFWVRSSLTGTFSLAIVNSAYARGYVTTYTVSAANTWEYKTVTIAGDTAGTWLTDNGVGLRMYFNLGAGSGQNVTPNTWGAWGGWGVSGAQNVVSTNGATFYITGVQLEKGSTATSFDYRPYGTELQLCQRYCPVVTIKDGIHYSGFCWSTSACRVTIPFQVETRVAPTGITTSATIQFLTSGLGLTGTAVFGTADVNHADIGISGGSGLTSGGSTALTTTSSAKIIFTGCEL